VSTVASEPVAILGHGSIGAVGDDHLGSTYGELEIELVTVAGLVADDTFRSLGRKHKAKEFLDETAFGLIGRGRLQGHRQAFGADPICPLDSVHDYVHFFDLM